MAIDHVLFVCGHNAGRSQMAQAFFNDILANESDRYSTISEDYRAISVGNNPGEELNQRVVDAMKEVGINLDNGHEYFPKGWDDEVIISHHGSIRRVIVACDDECDLTTSPLNHLRPGYWNLPDPHQQSISVVRRVRDATKQKVYELLDELEGI